MISEIYLINTTRIENEGAFTVCPLVPISPLFLSGDGFEPASVLFPRAAFHFPPKDKKEAYDFMDKANAEARIARVERKVRAMESDPFQWEWRNFDCVAMIPTMLRMYLRACGQVSGPVNAPVEVIPSDSEEDDDEEEDSNPWKRVKNDFEADDKNEASTSNPEPAMKELLPKPLP
ncbi:hypothetical protein AtNW77_Chr5g0121781 [Arabidopsis thaliana]